MKIEYQCNECGLMFDIHLDGEEDDLFTLATEDGVDCPLCGETGNTPI